MSTHDWTQGSNHVAIRTARLAIRYQHSIAAKPADIRKEPLSELEKQVERDWKWAFSSQEIRRRYSGMVVAVYQEKIWGSGVDHKGALAEAMSQPHCPEKDG